MLKTKILFCLHNLEKLVKKFLDLKDKCYKKVLRAQLNSYLQFLELQLEEENKDLVLFYNHDGITFLYLVLTVSRIKIFWNNWVIKTVIMINFTETDIIIMIFG